LEERKTLLGKYGTEAKLIPSNVVIQKCADIKDSKSDIEDFD